MFVVWTVALSAGGYRSRIAMIETNTFATIAEADLPLDVAVVGMAMGPRPPRAELVVHRGESLGDAGVDQPGEPFDRDGPRGRSGVLSGATNLARFCVAAGTTSLTVPNVPPGQTYYVRVRAVNGTGNGEPSNEVAVVVP